MWAETLFIDREGSHRQQSLPRFKNNGLRTNNVNEPLSAVNGAKFEEPQIKSRKTNRKETCFGHARVVWKPGEREPSPQVI